MAFPLDRSTYVKVGEAKGLEFLDELAPATVYDKCNWRCETCGLTYFKTYRAVYLGKHGCRCQNGMSMTWEQYHELETKFNIELIAKANNYKLPSKWYSPVTGNTVMASYYQIQYAPLKNVELLSELGITVVVGDRKPVLNGGVARRGKTTYEVDGITRILNPSELTPDSSDEDRERIAKDSEKYKKKILDIRGQYRLLNQEEEQGIIEIYDN